MNSDVHQTHCCVVCGCKYSDEDCPVVSGVVKQDHLCESCHLNGIHSKKELKRVVAIRTLTPRDRKEAIKIGLDGVLETLELGEYVRGDEKHKKYKAMEYFIERLIKCEGE